MPRVKKKAAAEVIDIPETIQKVRPANCQSPTTANRRSAPCSVASALFCLAPPLGLLRLSSQLLRVSPLSLLRVAEPRLASWRAAATSATAPASASAPAGALRFFVGHVHLLWPDLPQREQREQRVMVQERQVRGVGALGGALSFER